MNEDKSTELFLAKAKLKRWMWVLASVQLLFLAFIIAGQMIVQKEAADKWAEERGFRGGDRPAKLSPGASDALRRMRQKSASDTPDIYDWRYSKWAPVSGMLGLRLLTAFLGGAAKIYGGKDC